MSLRVCQDFLRYVIAVCPKRALCQLVIKINQLITVEALLTDTFISGQLNVDCLCKIPFELPRVCEALEPWLAYSCRSLSQFLPH